jgi:adhesin/invasin
MTRAPVVALVLALSLATCHDAVGPRMPVRAAIAVAPVLPSAGALADFGLTIDAVRFIVVRPAADTLADTTLALPPDSIELALDLRVPIVSVPETLRVSVVALAGTLPLFAGTRSVPVPSTLATPIPVDSFVGPVVDRILIQPQAAFIALNDSLRFQVQAFHGDVAVTQFYVAWSSSDSAVARINRFGVLRAPGVRAAVRVRARTPAGVSDSVVATFVPTASRLVATAGDLQRAIVGTTVGTDPAVRAEDRFGNPVSGASISFSVSGGGGSVAGATPLTNAAGVATVGSWTLGTTAGGNTLRATLSGVTPVTFTATATAGAATTVAKLAGDSQAAVVNTVLPAPAAVIARDQFGNPVSGVGVTFVAAGGGNVTGGSPTTDTAGVARVGTWRLGTLVGPNTLEASASGLAGSPVKFTANAARDVAAQLLRLSVDTQTAIAGQPVSVPPAVRVADQYGNAIPGASVTFTLTGAFGSVTPGAATTDSLGVARVTTWILATTPGVDTLAAAAPGLLGSPMTFSATGITTTATTMALSAGDGQTGVVNTALATVYSVLVTNAAGAAVQNVQVHWATGPGGGSMNPSTSLTDVNGIATSTRTLGTVARADTATASVGALTGSPVRFRATALPGAAAQLVKQSRDPQTGTVATVVTAPVLKVTDQFGNAVSGVIVDFAVLGGGTLGATRSTSDTAGLATAGTWTLGSAVGTNTVTVTSGALPAATFTATSVAGAPARLAFLVEPIRALAGDTMAPVQIGIHDQFGNRVLAAKDVVSLGLRPGSNAAAKLQGTVAAAPVNGVVTFANLAVDSAGVGDTLDATSGALGSTRSAPFDVGGVTAVFPSDRLQPVAAAFNPTNGLVYVPGVNNTLGVLDPAKGPISQLSILQSQPFGVAVNAVTNRVYVTTFGVLTGSVVVLDARTNALIVTIPLTGEGRGIAVDEATDRVYVAVAGDPQKLIAPSLAIIDGKDPRVIATIPFREGGQAAGVAFNSKDGLVYVAIPDLGVGVFDPVKSAHVATVSLVGAKGAAGTYGVAVDVQPNLVYATNRTEGTLSVIDPLGFKEVRRITVGLEPEGLGIDAKRGVVYVANSAGNTVSFIETGKFAVFATLSVGPTPKATAVNQTTGQVYVPTKLDDRVRVIQP